MDEFLKRLWFTAAFLLFSFNMIHVLMWVSGGYSRNWLFNLTEKLIWFEFWIFKISFILALAFGAWWFTEKIKSSIAKSEANSKEELRIAEHNKKAESVRVLHEGYEKTAQTNQAIAKQRKQAEFEKNQQQLKHERTGPRKEEDALQKALDSINYGGLS